jgi:formate hydrogenlyase transcriptional activator
MDHDWPGNVRELQNVIERAVILSVDGTLRFPHLPKRTAVGAHPGESTLDGMQRDYIVKVLEEANWIIGGLGGAARRLGLPRTTLISKMKRLGIPQRPSVRVGGVY